MSELTPVPIVDHGPREPVRPATGLERWVPWAIPALALVSTVHVALAEFGGPLGSVVDRALFGGATVLKLGAWLGLIVLLGRVHATLFGNVAAALRAFAVLAALPSVLVVAMALGRQRWAPWLSSDSAKYYFDGDSIIGSTVLAHRTAWSHHWAEGHVVLGEVGLIALFAAIHAFVGWRCGARGALSALFAIVLCEVALAGYLVKAPWSLWDYDFFHGDLVSSALLFDQLSIVALDPYTPIASAFYLATACASAVLLPSREPG